MLATKLALFDNPLASEAPPRVFGLAALGEPNTLMQTGHSIDRQSTLWPPNGALLTRVGVPGPTRTKSQLFRLTLAEMMVTSSPDSKIIDLLRFFATFLL